MAKFFGKRVFGKKNPVTLDELKQMDWNAPDKDGVTRVFSRELWDDPKIGDLLRSVGMTPDDPRNVRQTMDDYRARFDRSKTALDRRIEAVSADYRARYGHCRLGQMLIIDGPIWDGPHGSFLFGQLGLCAYDDWNVMLLGLDEATIRRCPVLPHVGADPSLAHAVEKKVSELHARYDHGLELFGLTATGRTGGISRETWDDLIQAIKDDLMAFVANARRVFGADLEKFADDIRSGKVKL